MTKMSSVNLYPSYSVSTKVSLTVDEFKSEVEKYCSFVERYLNSQTFVSLSPDKKKVVLEKLLGNITKLRDKVSSWQMMVFAYRFPVFSTKLSQTMTTLENLLKEHSLKKNPPRYYGTVFRGGGLFFFGCSPYSIVCEETILQPLVNSSVVLKDGKVLFSTQLPPVPDLVKDVRIRLEIFQKIDGKEIKVAEADGQRNQEIKNLATNVNVSLIPGTKVTFIFKTSAIEPNCRQAVKGNPIEVTLQVPGDTTPPAQVSEEKAEGVSTDFTQIRVVWKNPEDQDLKRVIVVHGKAEDISKIKSFKLTPELLKNIEKNVGGAQIAEGVFVAYATPLASNEALGAQKEILVSGLQADTEYAFRFFTVDVAGNVNSAEKIVQAKTVVDPNIAYRPKPIESPQVVQVTENSVELKWENPREDQNFNQVVVLRGKSSEELSSIKLEDGTRYVPGYVFKDTNGKELGVIVYVGNGQAYTDNMLKPNVMHHYAFRTMSERDPSKTVRYNNSLSAISAETLPASVGNLLVTEKSARSLTIGWQLESYNNYQETVVYYSPNPITLEDIKNNRIQTKISTKNNSVILNGLEPKTEYHIAVVTVAKNEKNETVLSSIQSIKDKTLDDATGPNAVKLKKVSVGEYEINLNWDLPAGETGLSVKIFFSEQGPINSSADLSRSDVIEACSGSNITSCKIEGLKPGKKYYWAIVPYGKENIIGQIANGDSTTKDLEPISNVSNTVGTDWIELKWQNPTQPYYKQVKVYMSENPITNLAGLSPITIADINSYKFQNLSQGKTYYFALVMVDNKNPANEAKPVMINVTTLVDTTPPDPVTNLKVGLDATKTGATVSWDAPKDGKKYVVVWSENPFTEADLSIQSGNVYNPGDNVSSTKAVTVGAVTQNLTATLSNLPAEKDIYIMVIPADEHNNYCLSGNKVEKIRTEDIVAPAPISSFSAKALSKGNAIELSWIGSVSPDLASTGTYVVFAAKDATQLPSQADLAKGTVYKAGDGVSGKSAKVVFVGDKAANSFEHSGLGDDETWHYAVFVRDAVGNYSIASTATAKTYGVVATQNIALDKGALSGVYLDAGKLTLKYFEPVVGPNTICLWSMEQNSILNNTNPICKGQITGNATYVDGLPGSGKQVLSFDGKNSIDVPFNVAFQQSSFSVSYFENSTSIAEKYQMRIRRLYLFSGTDKYTGWNCFYYPATIKRFVFRIYIDSVVNELSVTPLPTNVWTHVAFSYSALNQTMQFFINGKIVGTLTKINYSSAQNLAGINIGYTPLSSEYNYFGRMANIHYESQARNSFDMYEKNGSFTGLLDLKTENNTLDSNSKLTWTATGIVAGKSNIKLQIRTADTEQGLQNAKWGGLDAQGNYLEGGYYTVSGSIIKLAPSAGKRYVEVRAVFEGDGIERPVLTEVKIENLRVLNP